MVGSQAGGLYWHYQSVRTEPNIFIYTLSLPLSSSSFKNKKNTPKRPGRGRPQVSREWGCFTAIISDYNMKEISREFRSEVDTQFQYKYFYYHHLSLSLKILFRSLPPSLPGPPWPPCSRPRSWRPTLNFFVYFTILSIPTVKMSTPPPASL